MAKKKIMERADTTTAVLVLCWQFWNMHMRWQLALLWCSCGVLCACLSVLASLARRAVVRAVMLNAPALRAETCGRGGLCCVAVPGP